ncbi:MAG TPA: M15 family metallopeptidase [Thermoleophilaceae bacterium]|nr:M15 family metallopeptidase [Thermoleophilaceae bacterium]
MIRAIALLLALAAPATAPQGFHSSVKPLPASLQTELKKNGFWHRGCPVPLSGLRVLTVTYRGFDRHNHRGQMVVNASAAAPLAKVFHRLYQLHYPIKHMQLEDMYGPLRSRPADDDVTGSFSCRQAVPSPCVGGNGTGTWSMHAFGLAVDVNPLENPYVGCGQSRDPATKPYRDRSRHLAGMVTGKVVAAFSGVGWGWGGAWAGDTKDFMHFSSNGH